MIVSCQQCATQFHLDDAKVPEAGIRVRCSRCKFAFMVESPNGSALDHAASLALGALHSEAASMDDTESDWKFSEDVENVASSACAGRDLDAAAAAVDELLGHSNVAAEHRFDGVDGRDAFDLDIRDLEAPDFSVDAFSVDGSDGFGEVDRDGDSRLRARDEAHEDLSIDPEETDIAAEMTAFDPDSVTTSAAGRPDRTDASGFGGTAIEYSVAAAPAAVADLAIANPVETREPARSSESPGPHAFDLDGEAGAAPAWIVSARAVLGWAFVTSLCAAALFVGLVPDSPALPSVSIPVSVAGFEAQAVRASWIDNAVAGPIYVVSGSFRAPSPMPATGVELRVRLLNERGEPVSAASAAVGPSIPMAQLRESSPGDLRNRQESAARRFARRERVPWERHPFHAVFGGVPAEAAAFEFWAVEGAGAQAPEASLADPTSSTEATPPVTKGP